MIPFVGVSLFIASIVFMTMANLAFGRMLDEVAAQSGADEDVRRELTPRSKTYELIRRHRLAFPHSETRRNAAIFTVTAGIALVGSLLLWVLSA